MDRIQRIYYDYVDGLITKAEIPEEAKKYQLEMDKWYKKFVELKINIQGLEYTLKNGKVDINGRTYELRNGVVNINGSEFTPTSNNIKYSDLPEGAKHKVNMMVARANLYKESKNLSRVISAYAILTNSLYPPYEEIYDDCFYAESEKNTRIGTFAGLVKKKFDDKLDIDFGHGSLNTYGLKTLIDYKRMIINDMDSNELFDKSVSEDVSFPNQQARLKSMAFNSQMLEESIRRCARKLDCNPDLIGKHSNQISEDSATKYLLQIEQLGLSPDFVKQCTKNAIEYLTGSESEIANPENITHKVVLPEPNMDEYETYFDENDYPLRKNLSGNWEYCADGRRYYGVVYSEDHCPVMDPIEEYKYYKQSLPPKATKSVWSPKGDDDERQRQMLPKKSRGEENTR